MSNNTPSPEQLRAIQEQLGFTQSQMADIVGYPKTKTAKDGTPVADGAVWRKHTAKKGSATHRPLNGARLRCLAAYLVLNKASPETWAKIEALEKKLADS